jgi:hypothetical protein
MTDSADKGLGTATGIVNLGFKPQGYQILLDNISEKGVKNIYSLPH